jgi:serine protein kinase
MTTLLEDFDTSFSKSRKEETLTFTEFLQLAKKDPSVYASPAQRMLKAIGEPSLIDTRNDPRLSQIFSNKTIKVYPAFANFYGMEDAVEQIVAYFRSAADGLEESKQILYLLGPVGGGKSSIATRLRELMEQEPVYVIDGSPVFESPLSIFNTPELQDKLEADFNISRTAIRTIPSPWLIKKLEEVGSIGRLKVRKLYPSQLRQQASMRVEPGDENNQDVSAMVGKLNIRMIEKFEQDHPYAYSFSGGLNRGNNGIVEMVEMFKAPIKMLHPLLTATQERMYAGTEAIGSIPFDGIILAHSNESEWSTFRNNKNNEAFLDRVCIVKVPYCLRVTEEQQIYEKLIRNSEVGRTASIAPGTLKMLAEFCVMSRLIVPQNSTLFSKLRVYDGINIKAEDPKAKPIQEYRDDAGVKEGMEGLSTRFAFKMLSKTLAFDNEEKAANPIHLMYVLKTQIPQEQFPKEKEQGLIELIDGVLQEKYLEFLEKDITTAFLDSYSELCQNMLEQYYYYADAWVQGKDDYRDPSTNSVLEREDLDRELSKTEKPASISNPKDFRNDIVNFIIRYQAQHGGKLPAWNSYEKIRSAIEKRVIGNIDELLPVISFAPKRTEEDTKKHRDFLSRMRTRGYTERQTRILCEWFMRVRKSS